MLCVALRTNLHIRERTVYFLLLLLFYTTNTSMVNITTLPQPQHWFIHRIQSHLNQSTCKSVFMPLRHLPAFKCNPGFCILCVSILRLLYSFQLVLRNGITTIRHINNSFDNNCHEYKYVSERKITVLKLMLFITYSTGD